MDKQFMLLDKGYEGWDPELERSVPERVVIPDGMWVAPMLEQHSNCWRTFIPGIGKVRPSLTMDDDFVVGVTLGKERTTRCYLVRENRGETNGGSSSIRDFLAVAAQPFGVVNYYDASQERWGRFTPARQIHKGELGRKPGVTRKPRFVQTRQDSSQPAVAWARLTDLAAIVEMAPRDVLARYFPFVPRTRGDTNPRNQLRTVIADNEAEVTSMTMGMSLYSPALIGPQTEESEFIYSAEMRQRYPQLATRRRTHWDRSWADTHLEFERIWVSASWAMTVLYLHQFGHTPEPFDRTPVYGVTKYKDKLATTATAPLETR